MRHAFIPSAALWRGGVRSVRRSAGVSMSARSMAKSLPSWENLRSQVVRAAGEHGVGVAAVETWLGEAVDPSGDLHPPNTKDMTVRLFGKSEEDIRVNLFRDPAYWCPYCQRVQLQLEHKRIPYRIRTVNMRCYGSKPSYYLRLVPSGLLPAVEIDAKLITESQVIMMAIEDNFPEHRPLLPREGNAQSAALDELITKLMRLERECFAIWCQFLFRPSSDRSARAFQQAMQAWDDALEKINPSGPFVLGTEPCLVDIMAVPFFERYVATAIYWKGVDVRAKFLNTDRWMKAMESEVQAYRATKADLFSTVHDIPPQYGSAFMDKVAERYQRVIDGYDESWELPLWPRGDEDIEARSFEQSNEWQYRIEAAAAVIRGRERLARFATRALGPLPRTVSAPLCDPGAKASGGDRAIAKVDDAMKRIAQSLLTDGEGADRSFGSEEDEQDRENTLRALAYFRNRIGVPRDMSSGAARVLRAYTNRFSGQLLDDNEQWRKVREGLLVERA